MVEGFTAEEKAAMKERAAEIKNAKRGSKKNPEQDVLAKIDEMDGDDKLIAQRIHAVVMRAAPQLRPRTWYGMPAWELDGSVLCFLQVKAKFNSRYCTLGFNDNAQLDDGSMWPTAYALRTITKTIEAEVAALVTRAVGAQG